MIKGIGSWLDYYTRIVDRRLSAYGKFDIKSTRGPDTLR